VETLFEACKEASRAGAADVAKVEMTHAGVPLSDETALWQLLLDAEAAQTCLDEHQARIDELGASIRQKLLEADAAKNRKKGKALAREADSLRAEIVALQESEEHTDALRVQSGDRPLHGLFSKNPVPEELELAAILRPAISLTLLLHHNRKADGSAWWQWFDKRTHTGPRTCFECIQQGRSGSRRSPCKEMTVKVASSSSLRCLPEASWLVQPSSTQFVFQSEQLMDLDAPLCDLGICDGTTVDVFLAGQYDCGCHGPG